MKHRLVFLLFLCLGFAGFSAKAQENAPPENLMYNVADVAIDVTADSAAKARDEAIAKAQHDAFAMLLERLGADPKLGDKLSSDDLATLVQNFEVNDERSSAVRYIGNFVVQFRPSAVRRYLVSQGSSYSDTPSETVMVLPITRDGNRYLLWDEPSRWFKDWSNASKNGSTVPILIPVGSAQDQLALNPIDAALGKAESVKALMENYQANTTYVAVLNLPSNKSSTNYTVNLQRFESGYEPGSEVEHITLAVAPNQTSTDDIIAAGVKQIRQQIENERRDPQKKNGSAPSLTPASGSHIATPESVSIISELDAEAGAPSRLPVTVQFGTLADWAEIQRRLMASDGVKSMDVTSVGRGNSQIELGFAGRLEDVQLAMARHGLRLTQDTLSGNWIIRGGQ